MFLEVPLKWVDGLDEAARDVLEFYFRFTDYIYPKY